MNTSYTLAADALVAHVQVAGLAVPLATSFTVTGPEDAPVIVVLGGISAHRDAADSGAKRGWWREQVGPALALDTQRWRIVSFDWVGGPEAPLPPDATHLAPGPAMQARALAAILDRLQIAEAHAIVGASFGGQVALAFAAESPQRVGRVITLCAAARSSARARAFRHLQREALALGRANGTPAQGVALARAIAMLTYRTTEELEQRFGFDATTARTHDLAADFAHEPTIVPRSASIDAWLAHHGESFAERFDGAAFEALSRGLDEPAIERKALTRLDVPLFAFAVREDELVPVESVRTLVRLAPDATLHEHSSIFGHDAFLKDAAAVREFLETSLNAREVQS